MKDMRDEDDSVSDYYDFDCCYDCCLHKWVYSPYLGDMRDEVEST